ncbi:MAG TPA: ABC transporter permease, partial [Terriglobia bacterium]|nr:ABC transporter permease [Terriglobia bacterium]
MKHPFRLRNRLDSPQLGSFEHDARKYRILWLEQLWQDLHYGVRMLRKHPAFTALAVFTLAFGIGANTAMFSVVDGVLLQPPPFREPSRVMFVYQRQPNGGINIFSTPNFLEWKRQAGPLSQMAAVMGDSRTLGTKEGSERLVGWTASSEMFDVFGVSPALGRKFSPEEDRPGGGDVVVISDSLWKTRFQADPGILGTKLDLDGVPFTVIGVMPPGFHVFPYATEQY